MVGAVVGAGFDFSPSILEIVFIDHEIELRVVFAVENVVILVMVIIMIQIVLFLFDIIATLIDFVIENAHWH